MQLLPLQVLLGFSVLVGASPWVDLLVYILNHSQNLFFDLYLKPV